MKREFLEGDVSDEAELESGSMVRFRCSVQFVVSLQGSRDTVDEGATDFCSRDGVRKGSELVERWGRRGGGRTMADGRWCGASLAAVLRLSVPPLSTSKRLSWPTSVSSNVSICDILFFRFEIEPSPSGGSIELTSCFVVSSPL